MRDMLDAAWGDFPTEDVGYDWARYTGNARPSREWCAAVSVHSRVTFIQETTSERSQQGFQAGVYDCQFAESRARAVHPGVDSLAVVVSDGNYADRWDASEYGRGWASVATMAFFPYGAVPICESFIRGAGGSPFNLSVTWVPETWGAGTAMSQVVGFSPVSNTDLNHVWLPYYPTTAPTPPTLPQEDDDDMRIMVFNEGGKDHHLWVGADAVIRVRTYNSGAANPVAVIPVPGGAAIDATVGLALVDTGFGKYLYGATADGRELQLSPSPFGYIASVH